MAKIFPKIDEGANIERFNKSAAERKLYGILKNELDNEFTVFYSIAWPALDGGPLREREIDFIILHPLKGLLLMEVKGGLIFYDSDTQVWVSMNRDKQTNEIENPFLQVLNSQRALVNRLKRLETTKKYFIPIASCVCFPNNDKISGEIIEIEPKMIILNPDLSRMSEKIDEVYASLLPNQSNSAHFKDYNKQVFEAIRLLFNNHFQIQKSFSCVLKEGEEFIDELTENQIDVLMSLNRNNRVAISGSAGTGKTLLAIHQAKLLANEGFRTLYTCFNRMLTDVLGEQNKDIPNLKIINFHQLCHTYCQQAGPDFVARWDKLHAANNSEFWEKETPLLLLSAVEKLGPSAKFDAVIIDEGQDFSEDWTDSVHSLLANEESSVSYIFYDNNQRLYPRGIKIPDNYFKFNLFKNLRNSKEIFNLSKRFYSLNDKGVIGAGPEGGNIVFHKCTPTNLESEVLKIYKDLIRSKEIKPHQIAILTGTSLQKCLPKIFTDPEIKNKVSDDFHFMNEKSLVQTIYKFKGLEKPIIILTGLDDITDDEKREKLLYVGIKRAKVHLIIVASKTTIDWIQDESAN